MEWWQSRGLVLVGAGFGLALLAGIAWLFMSLMDKNEAILPVVILLSVVALLIVLAMFALLLSELGLANPKEALGLPSGSVRAVIAIMLFVVFAIIAIYLFSVVIQVDTAAGVDLAKQLVILLGTLVTAVASFYFGSNSITSAQASLARAQAGSGGPSASRASPPQLTAGGAGQRLTISGTNLAKVVHVQLTREGADPILADNGTISAKDLEVTCSVDVREGAEGTWSVVVSDHSDNSSRVKDAITIVAPAADDEQDDESDAGADETTITEVVTKQIRANDSPQDVTVRGTNLDKVNSMKLTQGANESLSETGVTVNDDKTEATCKFKIKPGPTGDWSLAVLGKDGKPVAPTDQKIKIVA